MKKWGIITGLLLANWVTTAAPLPDNTYMQAMHDELTRSMAKLRRPGVEKPYFIAYKLEQLTLGAVEQAS